MAAEATCAVCATSEVVYTAHGLHEWSERHGKCADQYPHALKVLGFEEDAHVQSKAVAESTHPDGIDVQILTEETGEEFCSFHLGPADAHLAQYFADQAGVSLVDWIEIAIKKATIGA